MSNELKFYGHNANEETASFNKRESWNREDTLDEKYLEFLAPHSQPYFSRLRPIFSFEIKSLTALNAFSHILLRDGVLFLMKFFQRFPRPSGLMCKIFVHRKLSCFIPESWREHILFYDIWGPEVGEAGQNERKHLFLYTSYFKNLNDENSLNKLVSDIQQYQKNNPDLELHMVSGLNILRGEDFLDYDRSWAMKESHDLISGIEAKKVHFHNFSEMGGLLSDLRNESVYLNYHPYDFFFCDSFVDHYFLGQNIPPLRKRPEAKGEKLSLSAYHGMVLCPKKDILEDFHPLLKGAQFPSGSLFSKEGQVDRAIEDYFKVQYYSSDFEKMALEIAKEIFSK